MFYDQLMQARDNKAAQRRRENRQGKARGDKAETVKDRGNRRKICSAGSASPRFRSRWKTFPISPLTSNTTHTCESPRPVPGERFSDSSTHSPLAVHCCRVLVSSPARPYVPPPVSCLPPLPLPSAATTLVPSSVSRVSLLRVGLLPHISRPLRRVKTDKG